MSHHFKGPGSCLHESEGLFYVNESIGFGHSAASCIGTETAAVGFNTVILK